MDIIMPFVVRLHLIPASFLSACVAASRCVDGVLRVVFTVETLSRRPSYNQPEGGELKIEGWMDRVGLEVDGQRVGYRHWNGGADAQVWVGEQWRRYKEGVEEMGWGGGRGGGEGQGEEREERGGYAGVATGVATGAGAGRGRKQGRELKLHVTIGIKGFSQQTSFPLSQCISSEKRDADVGRGKKKGNGIDERAGQGESKGADTRAARDTGRIDTDVAVNVNAALSLLSPAIIMHVHTFDQVL